MRIAEIKPLAVEISDGKEIELRQVRVDRADGTVIVLTEEGQKIGVYAPVADGDPSLRVTKRKDGFWVMLNSRRSLFIFDQNGYLISQRDGYDNAIFVKRAADGFPEALGAVFDDDGKAEGIQFSRSKGHRNRIGSAIAGGHVWKYDYDSAGNLVRVIPPGRSAEEVPIRTLDPEGRLKQLDLPGAGKMEIHYNDHGWVSEVSGPGEQKLSFKYSAEPSSVDYSVRVTDGEGVWQEKQVEKIGSVVTFRNSGTAELVTETFADGRTQIREIGKGGAVRTILETGPASENGESWRDSSGGVHMRSADLSTGLPVIQTGPFGSQRWEYNQSGNIVREETESGGWKETLRSSTGRVEEVKSNTSPPVNFSNFNKQGLPMVVALADTKAQLSYDEFGRLSSAGEFRFDRLPTGELLGIETDKGEKVFAERRDGLGRVVARSRGDGRPTLFEYDAAGNQNKIVCPGENPVFFAYTPGGRLNRIQYPDGSQKMIQRDQAEQISAIIHRDGSRSEREYDEFGRVIGVKNFNAGDLPEPSDHLRFRYHPDDKLEEASDSDSRVVRNLDARGLIMSERQNDWRIGFQYDDHGRRSGLIYPDETKSVLTRDAGGKVQSMQSWAGPVEFRYDQYNRLISWEFVDLDIQVSRNYDDTGQVNTVSVARGVKIIYTSSVERNRKGLIAAEVDSLGTNREYSHDSGGTLQEANGKDVGRVIYNADDRANLLNTDGLKPVRSTGADGLVVGTANDVITHDAGGRIEKLSGRNFSYDTEGRLTSVQLEDARVIRYRYDALERLISRKIDGGDTIHYLYDGWNIIAEYVQRAEQSVLEAKYLHGADLDFPLAMKKDEEVYLFIQDPKGNVVSLISEEGKLAASYSYAPFGKPILTDENIPSPFRFAGALWDKDAQIYHMRMRAYDPLLGRFLQPDPTDFSFGLNLYAYAENSPLGISDPLGLWSAAGVRSSVNGWAQASRDRLAATYENPSISMATRFGAAVAGTATQFLTGEEIPVSEYGSAAKDVGSAMGNAGAAATLSGGGAVLGQALSVVGGAFQVAGDVMKGDVGLKTVSTGVSSLVSGYKGVVGSVNFYVKAASDGLSVGSDLHDWRQTGYSDHTKLVGAISKTVFGVIKADADEAFFRSQRRLEVVRQRIPTAMSRIDSGARADGIARLLNRKIDVQEMVDGEYAKSIKELADKASAVVKLSSAGIKLQAAINATSAKSDAEKKKANELASRVQETAQLVVEIQRQKTEVDGRIDEVRRELDQTKIAIGQKLNELDTEIDLYERLEERNSNIEADLRELRRREASLKDSRQSYETRLKSISERIKDASSKLDEAIDERIKQVVEQEGEDEGFAEEILEETRKLDAAEVANAMAMTESIPSIGFQSPAVSRIAADGQQSMGNVYVIRKTYEDDITRESIYFENRNAYTVSVTFLEDSKIGGRVGSRSLGLKPGTASYITSSPTEKRWRTLITLEKVERIGSN